MGTLLWLKWFHIVAALWMAAGAFGSAVVRAELKRQGEVSTQLILLRLLRRLHRVYLVPGLLGSGVLGIGLLHPLGYGFRPGWVHATLALWLLLVGATLSVAGPHLRDLERAAATALARPEAKADLERLLSKRMPLFLADGNALGILIFSYLMVARPF
jgi:putative membrane protein